MSDRSQPTPRRDSKPLESKEFKRHELLVNVEKRQFDRKFVRCYNFQGL